MFLLHRPSPTEIERFLVVQRQASFSYSEPGASRTGVLAGYTADHRRIQIGSGESDFTRAVEALRRWEMFRLGWVELLYPPAFIAVGTTVGVLVHHFGFWSLNACRVVYVLDEDGSIRRFGFAYGTLMDHAETGEERFCVEWCREEDDSVWYDLLAYSHPRHLLAKLAYPLTRGLQKRFGRDSQRAMKAAVSDHESGSLPR